MIPSAVTANNSSDQVPHKEYTKCLTARRAALERHRKAFDALAYWRLGCVVSAGVLAWTSFGTNWTDPWWIGAPVLAFIGLAIYHETVDRRVKRALRAVRFYDHGLARLEDRWRGLGETGERFADPAHPYAGDLDLFGEASLFQLLCLARTRAGEETLAGWLREPGDLEVISARQEAIRELRGKVDLREDLALLGEDVRSGIHPADLIEWAQAPTIRFPNGARALALVLSVAAVATLTAALAELISYAPAGLILLSEAALALRLRERAARVVGAVDRPSQDLDLLAEVLARLEGENFAAPCLVALRARLSGGDRRASEQIARLHRLVEYLDWRGNQVFGVLAPLFMWTTQFAMAIEAWRQECGRHVPDWLQAVGELEALCSLAGYSYEHPNDTLPEFTGEPGLFEAEGLGHPLIPAAELVRNDLKLAGDLRLLVVSGSNMSGKSTLLRAVGVNAVLAQAGAPVRADRLKLSRLSIGASMRSVDSLQEHTSRFYAEIKRLRQIVGLTDGSLPTIFLLDELLSGTNSHDRRIGAEATVKGLVERGAIGLVTTHDLALTKITEDLGPQAANVHFEDQLVEGKMVFDFKMRPGVVERSNALALMRSIGLDV